MSRRAPYGWPHEERLRLGRLRLDSTMPLRDIQGVRSQGSSIEPGGSNPPGSPTHHGRNRLIALSRPIERTLRELERRTANALLPADGPRRGRAPLAGPLPGPLGGARDEHPGIRGEHRAAARRFSNRRLRPASSADDPRDQRLSHRPPRCGDREHRLRARPHRARNRRSRFPRLQSRLPRSASGA